MRGHPQHPSAGEGRREKQHRVDLGDGSVVTEEVEAVEDKRQEVNGRFDEQPRDELQYGKEGFKPVRWVVAVPIESKIKSLKDLEGKRVATELMGFTKRFLRCKDIKAEVDFSWGATEVKPPHLADAIVELTETGSSLRANNLRIVETIIEWTTRFIANRKAWQDRWKRRKMENIALLLKGALAAGEKVGLKMNVPEKAYKRVLTLLSAMHSPTIAQLSDPGSPLPV